MSGFENGRFLGATWAIRGGVPQRVHFLVNCVRPDGDLLVPKTVLGPDGREIRCPATRVPVEVVYDVSSVSVENIPSIDVIRASWGNFSPAENFRVPLPQ